MALLDHCSLSPFAPPVPSPLLVLLTLCASPLPLVHLPKAARVLATSTSENVSLRRRRLAVAAEDVEDKAPARMSSEVKVYVSKGTPLCPPTGAAPSASSAGPPPALKAEQLTRTTARTSPSFTPLLPGLIAGGVGITLVPQRPWIPQVPPPFRDRQSTTPTTTTTKPYFLEEEVGSNVTGRAGSAAYLDCRVEMQQDSTVTWLHRKEDSIQLLTVGRRPYSGDSRFFLSLEDPNNWRLQILPVMKSDEGLYECQIAEHPSKVRRVYFQVTAPELKIVDEDRNELLERHYKAGSEVKLTCLVTQLQEEDVLGEAEGEVFGGGDAYKEMKGVDNSTSTVLEGAINRVLWRHGDSTITRSTAKRTLRIISSADGRNASVALTIHDIKAQDGGNYTCSLGVVSSESVHIKIFNGESNNGNGIGHTKDSAVPLGLIELWLLNHIVFISLITLISHAVNQIILRS